MFIIYNILLKTEQNKHALQYSQHSLTTDYQYIPVPISDNSIPFSKTFLAGSIP